MKGKRPGKIPGYKHDCYAESGKPSEVAANSPVDLSMPASPVSSGPNHEAWLSRESTVGSESTQYGSLFPSNLPAGVPDERAHADGWPVSRPILSTCRARLLVDPALSSAQWHGHSRGSLSAASLWCLESRVQISCLLRYSSFVP